MCLFPLLLPLSVSLFSGFGFSWTSTSIFRKENEETSFTAELWKLVCAQPSEHGDSDLRRSEIPHLFLLPFSPHLYFCSPHLPSLFILLTFLSIPRLCTAWAPSPLVFPTLPQSEETHKCMRAAPKQRGKSWPGRWHGLLLVRPWDLRLSTQTRALFSRARRCRKFLARILVFADKHFRGRDTHSSKLTWAVSCHCREVHNDNYSLGLYPWIKHISLFFSDILFLSLSHTHTHTHTHPHTNRSSREARAIVIRLLVHSRKLENSLFKSSLFNSWKIHFSVGKKNIKIYL